MSFSGGSSWCITWLVLYRTLSKVLIPYFQQEYVQFQNRLLGSRSAWLFWQPTLCGPCKVISSNMACRSPQLTTQMTTALYATVCWGNRQHVCFIITVFFNCSSILGHPTIAGRSYVLPVHSFVFWLLTSQTKIGGRLFKSTSVMVGWLGPRCGRKIVSQNC